MTTSILLDTDIGSDSDDAGALALLHTLCARREAALLAVTHSTALRYGGACIEAINAYYNRPDIPIGVNHNPRWRGREADDVYAGALAGAAGLQHRTADTYPAALSVLRSTLSAAADGSVTLVSIGQFFNLCDLIDSSPDAASPLTGGELVRRKVRSLVMMAGFFDEAHREDFRGHFSRGGSDYNIARGISAARRVVDVWPTPLVFSGLEIGFPVYTGQGLCARVPADHPVRMAYETAGHAGGRHSWDQTAALFAVRGAAEYWDLSPAGTVRITPQGRSPFTPGAGQHHYLIPRMDVVTLAAELESLMAPDPPIGTVPAAGG